MSITCCRSRNECGPHRPIGPPTTSRESQQAFRAHKCRASQSRPRMRLDAPSGITRGQLNRVVRPFMNASYMDLRAIHTSPMGMRPLVQTLCGSSGCLGVTTQQNTHELLGSDGHTVRTESGDHLVENQHDAWTIADLLPNTFRYHPRGNHTPV